MDLLLVLFIVSQILITKAAAYSGELLLHNVDECLLGTDNCDENAECKDTNGSYECECKNGFIGNGTICNDINECATGLYRCVENADCINTIGNFTCQCRDGVHCAAGIGPSIDTTTLRVRPNDELLYTIGTSICLEDSPLNKVIDKILFIICRLANQPIPFPTFVMTLGVVRNEMETNILERSRHWVIYDLNTTLNTLLQEDTTAIKVTCSASNAYGSDKAFTLIKLCGPTECQDSITNACTQLCSRNNDTMTHYCSCMSGYNLNVEDQNMCDDIDECTDPAVLLNCSAAENLECNNTDGSFTCDCKAGYSRQSSGQCEDVNECMDTSLHTCSQAGNEDCQNTDGSFACICKIGSRRIDTNQQCLDIDECIENNHNCSLSENEVCVNIKGSFTCECANGYSRNTSSGLCSDINECADSAINCSIADNKICTNTDGSYTCNCIPDYFQNEPNGLCKGGKECDPLCHHHAVCTNTSSGTFDCQCKNGYDGDGITSCQASISVIGGALGALSFLLLTGILSSIAGICCYIRYNSYKLKEKDTGIQHLDIERPNLDSEVGETKRMFSVQTSYKLNLPPHLLIHCSSMKLIEPIGQGEFGIVYKGHIVKEPGPVITDIVAVKTLKGFYDTSTVREMMKECSKMYKFDHPNVLTLKGVCLDGGPAPYIIMPFMANGSLLAYLRKNRDSLVIIDKDNNDDEIKNVEKQLIDMCLQIAKGMEYLTFMKVVHRDLAARNCMIDMNFVIKVADFGLSESIGTKQYFRQDKFTDVKLPIRWLAPESLEDCVFSHKSDVWAYGVTSWEVFTGGKTPYPGVDPTDLPQQLANGHRLEKPTNSACSDEMYGFLLNCWIRDPKVRPSFSDLVPLLSQSLEAMVGYMDVTAFKKYADNSSTVKASSSEDKNGQSGHLSSHGNRCTETVM